jgi:hypothetical protein
VSAPRALYGAFDELAFSGAIQSGQLSQLPVDLGIELEDNTFFACLWASTATGFGLVHQYLSWHMKFFWKMLL